MSNKLYLTFFTALSLFLTLNNSYARIAAYDDETGSVVELVDFDYGRYNFVEGQVIEYFDFDSSRYKYAIVKNIQDNFSSIILTVVDKKTEEIRKLTVNIEN